MITTEDSVILLLDSIETFTAPALVCFARYDVESENAVVDVSIRNGDGEHIRYADFSISKTDLNAQTITASDNVDKWMQAVELALKEKLESLNPGATFTIT